MNSDSDTMNIDGWGTAVTAEENAPLADEMESSMTAVAMVDDGDGFAEDFEVLPLRFLETPEEAEAERSEQAFHLAARRHTGIIGAPSSRSSSRSSRRSRKEPKQLSVRQIKIQRRAKFIIYGGIISGALLVLVIASYKLPIVLYNYGKISKPYVWPWGFLYKDWEKGQAEPDKKILKTKDGRQFDQKEMDTLATDARIVLPKCQRLLEEAIKTYDEGEGDKVKALVIITKAQQMLEPIANRLDPVKDLQIFERTNRKADRLVDEIGFKFANWRKGLNVQEIDQLNAELKKAGLIKDEAENDLP